METPGNSVRANEYIREPDAVYTPSSAKAKGYGFKGFVVRDTRIHERHDQHMIEGAAFCAIQDQILWLTDMVFRLESAKQVQDAINDALSKKLQSLSETECKDMTTMAASLKAHGELIGSILEERAKHAAITKPGIESALKGRTRPTRKRTRAQR